MRIGFAGLGRMGLPMLGHLVRAGHTVYAYDIDPARVDLATRLGALAAARPVDAAAGTDVTVTMVPDATAVREVLVGAQGMCQADVPAGHVHVDMGTTGVRQVIELARQTEKAGWRFLDAPVSGSVAFAEDALLTTMVGGAEETFHEMRDVLAAMTKAQFHVGQTGCGAAMKLAVNSVVATINQALSEALVFAERSGIATAAAYDVLEQSAAGAPYLRYKRDWFVDPTDQQVSAPTALLEKDLALALDQARTVGAHMPVIVAVHEIVASACGAGYGLRDMASLAQLVRQMAAENGRGEGASG